jgi:hypothetical protein
MKEKKSASELEAMIMQEVRKHPALIDVQGVLIAENPERIRQIGGLSL